MTVMQEAQDRVHQARAEWMLAEERRAAAAVFRVEERDADADAMAKARALWVAEAALKALTKAAAKARVKVR